MVLECDVLLFLLFFFCAFFSFSMWMSFADQADLITLPRKGNHYSVNTILSTTCYMLLLCVCMYVSSKSISLTFLINIMPVKYQLSSWKESSREAALRFSILSQNLRNNEEITISCVWMNFSRISGFFLLHFLIDFSPALLVHTYIQLLTEIFCLFKIY